MTTFVAEQDDGWLDDDWVAPEPFEVDGIVYDAREAYCWEAADRPPMFEIKSEDECYCANELLAPSDTCSWAAYRWVPGQTDMPPLRFGGAA